MFMPIFGKKKPEVKMIPVEPIKPVKNEAEPFTSVEQFIKEVGKSEQVQQKQEAQPKQERPAFAPLFIKLDRYKNILSAITELKTTLVMIKNSFSVFNELDKIKEDNLKVVASAIERVDKRIAALDSEFLRPSGYREELPEEVYAVESLDTTLSDLRYQVDQLKAELESLH
jgi:hypothetical protein